MRFSALDLLFGEEAGSVLGDVVDSVVVVVVLFEADPVSADEVAGSVVLSASDAPLFSEGGCASLLLSDDDVDATAFEAGSASFEPDWLLFAPPNPLTAPLLPTLSCVCFGEMLSLDGAGLPVLAEGEWGIVFFFKAVGVEEGRGFRERDCPEAAAAAAALEESSGARVITTGP